jgi:predicted lipid-binding transport protein (Tim44 family)
VINKAIENNYQLPESFFNSNGSGQKGASRNPKRFYSAWTLIAIGVPFIVLAFLKGEAFFGLVGAICTLIGLGRMIGYYTISNDAPQYPRPPYGYQPPFQQPPYQQPYQAPYQPMNNQPMQNAPQPADAPQAPAPDVPNNDSNQRQTPPPYNPAQ